MRKLKVEKTVLINIRYYRPGTLPDSYVYIGRPSDFGNPIRQQFSCPVCTGTHRGKGETIPCFKVYFYARLDRDKEFKEKVHALKGKTLGCYCAPYPCHGDVIIEYLDSLER